MKQLLSGGHKMTESWEKSLSPFAMPTSPTHLPSQGEGLVVFGFSRLWPFRTERSLWRKSSNDVLNWALSSKAWRIFSLHTSSFPALLLTRGKVMVVG